MLAASVVAAPWTAGPVRAQTPAPAASDGSIPQRVEIRRTEFGVPHILAEDLEAAFYGLAWAHLEDHGERVVLGLVRARGDLSRHLGREELESDF